MKEKRRTRIVLTAVLLTAALSLLAACDAPAQKKEAAPYRAAFLITGALGDQSFFDSAYVGLTALQDELGKDVFDFEVSEMGGTAAEQADWEATLLKFCDTQKYDVIILGSWREKESLDRTVALYPDQRFILFDDPFDFAAAKNPKNLYNMTFRANEAAYLTGAAAALMAGDAEIPHICGSGEKLGFLGGMDSTVVNDFLAGYTQGAKDINADIEIEVAYVGNYFDAGKARELAQAQYQNGVDISFNVAGAAGLGQLETAARLHKYVFGTDSDQAVLLPDCASSIPSSAMKNIGSTLNLAIRRDMDGQLPYGSAESFGLAEGSVGLVKDAHYEQVVPAKIRERVDPLEQDIIGGKITVDTALE